MTLGTVESMRSEILRKIVSVVAYHDADWIRLYVYKNTSIRLNPIRVEKTIVFLDCATSKEEATRALVHDNHSLCGTYVAKLTNGACDKVF